MDESATKRPRKNPDGSSRARIAVVGAGSWSQGWHLPQLHRNPEAEITAIVDPSVLTWSKYNKNMKPTKELAEYYGVPKFDDIDSFLSSDVATSTHGVIIASSHSSHHDVGMKTVRAGLHILMEKPMTTDTREAMELVDAVASSDKVFIVNNSANFRPSAIRAHRLVTAGEVGKIEYVNCYMMREREFFEDPKNTAWVKPSGTMLGNGFAWGQLSHTLAWVFMVTGLAPESVFCNMVFSKLTGADLFSSASIRCACGACISMQGAAGLPGSNAVGTSANKGKLIENKIFGTEGCLFYSGDDADPNSGGLVLSRHDGTTQTHRGFHFENTSQEGVGPESLQAFIDACLGKTFFNAADAQVGLKVVQTLDSMYRSALSGQVEKVTAK